MSVSGTYVNDFCLKGLPVDVQFIVVLESTLKVYSEDNIKRGETKYALKSKPITFCSPSEFVTLYVSDWEDIGSIKSVLTVDDCHSKNLLSHTESENQLHKSKINLNSSANFNQNVANCERMYVNNCHNGYFDNRRAIHHENEVPSSIISDLASQTVDHNKIFTNFQNKGKNCDLYVSNSSDIGDGNCIYYAYSDNKASKCLDEVRDAFQRGQLEADAIDDSNIKHNHSKTSQINPTSNALSEHNTCGSNSLYLDSKWNTITIELKVNKKTGESESQPNHIIDKIAKANALGKDEEICVPSRAINNTIIDLDCGDRRTRKRKVTGQSFTADLNDGNATDQLSVYVDTDDEHYIREIQAKLIKYDDKILCDSDESLTTAVKIDNEEINCVKNDLNSQVVSHKYSIRNKGKNCNISNSSEKSHLTKLKKKCRRKPKFKSEKKENLAVVKSKQNTRRKCDKEMTPKVTTNPDEEQNQDTSCAKTEQNETENVKTPCNMKQASVEREIPLRKAFAKKRQFKPKDPDDSLVKIDTEGLDPKLVYAAKMLEKQKIKDSRRIQVDILENHPDKYRITQVVSTAQKDRRKSREEKSYHSYECTICGRFQCIVQEKMRVHIEQHVNGDLECKKCGYILSYMKEIVRHNAQVHILDNAKMFNRICELCGVTSSTLRGWKTHMSKIHKIPSFECQHCDLKFSSGNSVVVHTRDSHADKNIPCEKCGQVFVSRSNWSYHVVRCNGTRTDSHICDQCGTSLTTAIALRRHVRHNHEKERTHKCSMCPYTTFTIAGLQKHVNAHLGNKQYRCQLCNFSSVQKYQLTSHMRTHNGDRPYKCDKCPYAVAWNVQLKAHKKVHDLPYTVHCKICGVVLKDARSLSKHESRDHGSIKGATGSGPVTEGNSKNSGSNFMNMNVGMEAVHMDTNVLPNVADTNTCIPQVPVPEAIPLPEVQDVRDAMDMRTFRTYTPLEAADYQINRAFFQYGF